MRGEAAQHLDEVLCHRPIQPAVPVDLIDEDHHLRDRCIEVQRLDITRNLLHREVVDIIQLSGRFIRDHAFARDHAIDTFQPLSGPIHALVAPWQRSFQRTHEHFIHAQRICTMACDKFIRVHDIAKGFRHLDPVGAENHALVEQFLERLVIGNHPAVMQYLVPESGIQQMQHRMFRTADIQIHRQPVIHELAIGNLLVIMRIQIADIVPAGTSPLRHCIRFTLALHAVNRDIQPVGAVGKRRLAIRRRLIVISCRQFKRQIVFRYRPQRSIFHMDDRNRLAPVALTREQPVSELVLNLALTDLVFLKPVNHLRNCFFLAQTIQPFGVDMHPIASIGLCFDIAALQNRNDRQMELLCKLIVTRIMRRHCHDRTGAISRQNIIRNPDRNFSAIDRIDRICACEDTRLFLVQIRTVQIALLGRFHLISPDCVFLLGRRDEIDKRMLWRHDTVGRSEQRIAARREDREFLIGILDLENDFCTDRLADPVALHIFRGLRPVDRIQIIQQLLCIGRDAQHPLPHHLPHDRISADGRLAFNDLFIGQHRAKLRAPVHRHLRGIGKASFIHLQEDPLGPAIIIRIAGADFPVPVIRESERLDLITEVINVPIREFTRMMAGLQGILFCRQTECIESHRVHDVVSLHPLHAGNHVSCRIAFRMPYMQALPGRIRKHIQNIILRLREVIGIRSEGLMIFPVLLPFLLNLLMIVHELPPSLFLAPGKQKTPRRI